MIRVMGDNFRLSERLLTQIERVTEINRLTQVTKEGSAQDGVLPKQLRLRVADNGSVW